MSELLIIPNISKPQGSSLCYLNDWWDVKRFNKDFTVNFSQKFLIISHTDRSKTDNLHRKQKIIIYNFLFLSIFQGLNSSFRIIYVFRFWKLSINDWYELIAKTAGKRNISIHCIRSWLKKDSDNFHSIKSRSP